MPNPERSAGNFNEGNIIALDLSPDDAYVCCGTNNGSLIICDAQDKNMSVVHTKSKVHNSFIFCVRFSNFYGKSTTTTTAGNYFLGSAGSDQTARVFDCSGKDFDLVRKVDPGYGSSASIDFCPSKPRKVVSSHSNSTLLWRVETSQKQVEEMSEKRKRLFVVPSAGEGKTSRFGPGFAKDLVGVVCRKKVVFYNHEKIEIASSHELKEGSENEHPDETCCWSRDGSYFACGGCGFALFRIKASSSSSSSSTTQEFDIQHLRSFDIAASKSTNFNSKNLLKLAFCPASAEVLAIGTGSANNPDRTVCFFDMKTAREVKRKPNNNNNNNSKEKQEEEEVKDYRIKISGQAFGVCWTSKGDGVFVSGGSGCDKILYFGKSCVPQVSWERKKIAFRIQNFGNAENVPIVKLIKSEYIPFRLLVHFL